MTASMDLPRERTTPMKSDPVDDHRHHLAVVQALLTTLVASIARCVEERLPACEATHYSSATELLLSPSKPHNTLVMNLSSQI